MASFNKIIICGYLGRDCETRYLPDGTAVTSFSIATNERKKDRSGDVREVATWFKISAFGRLAEICAEYLTKGSLAYIEGKLSQEEYTDKEGNKRTTLAVRANDVQFLDRKPQGDGRPADELEGAHQHITRRQSASKATENDEIPFK